MKVCVRVFILNQWFYCSRSGSLERGDGRLETGEWRRENSPIVEIYGSKMRGIVKVYFLMPLTKRYGYRYLRMNTKHTFKF